MHHLNSIHPILSHPPTFPYFALHTPIFPCLSQRHLACYLLIKLTLLPLDFSISSWKTRVDESAFHALAVAFALFWLIELRTWAVCWFSFVPRYNLNQVFSPHKKLQLDFMEMGRETFEDSPQEKRYLMGVRRLCENGIESIPSKYIWPLPDRPAPKESEMIVEGLNLKLPVIDLEQLQSSNRSRVLKSLANACEEFGFFQVVNHGIPSDVISRVINVSQRFFELPFEQRARFMSGDMFAPVRYGTSVNQDKDGIFCWRDFLKLTCHPLAEASTFWPSTPADLREEVAAYAKATKSLFFILIKAVLESLGLEDGHDDDDILEELEDGSQLMVINCYPSCPEPDLTLGMPPHSDYGFLTLLLQDGVKGLQVQYQGEWLTVEPLANSFVVNVGDHLEIFSNGKYKSVLHRVFVNSSNSRISVVSLHSLPYEKVVRPCPSLINAEIGNPRRYKDTDFATFLQYISSRESKGKTFLESRTMK